jgi:hypothetical protein
MCAIKITKQTEKVWRNTRLYVPQLPSTYSQVRFRDTRKKKVRFRDIYSWLLCKYNLVMQAVVSCAELFTKHKYLLLASKD